MDITLAVHIVAGTVALVSGYVALYARKGGTVHRKLGMAFVYSMLVMCAFGVVVSAAEGVAMALNIPAATLSAYLVVTSLITVRPPARGGRAIQIAAMAVAAITGLIELAFAFSGGRNGIPPFPFLMFGTVAIIGVTGDLKVLRSGALQGPKRLARHLWRMTFALFIAAMSFFVGQADVIPKAIRIRPLLAVPVLAVLVTMVYWLRRVRRSRASPAVVAARTAVAA